MKIDQFREATQKMKALQEIDLDINKAMEFFGVTLQGIYQDGVLKDVARAAVIEELQKQRQAIVAELKELGVDVDGDGEPG